MLVHIQLVQKDGSSSTLERELEAMPTVDEAITVDDQGSEARVTNVYEDLDPPECAPS
jgi:hypothetical protein